MFHQAQIFQYFNLLWLVKLVWDYNIDALLSLQSAISNDSRTVNVINVSGSFIIHQGSAMAHGKGAKRNDIVKVCAVITSTRAIQQQLQQNSYTGWILSLKNASSCLNIATPWFSLRANIGQTEIGFTLDQNMSNIKFVPHGVGNNLPNAFKRHLRSA